jgi:hypothetical protein
MSIYSQLNILIIIQWRKFGNEKPYLIRREAALKAYGSESM